MKGLFFPDPDEDRADRMNWRFDRDLLTRVWQLAWPTVVYSLLQTLVGLVDVYMVGRLGKEAIAAVGFSQQVLMLIMIGALGVNTGTITLVAQFVGAGKRDQAGRVAGQALLSMFALGVAIGIPGVLWARQFLALLGARGPVLIQGSPYLRLMLAGSSLMMLNFAVAFIFRGAADAVTPLKIAVGVNLTNVVGNWLFIFGIGPFPRLGVAGAAVGSLVARAFGAIVGIALLTTGWYRVRLRFARGAGLVDFSLIRRILNIGLPAAGQGFFRNGARVLFFRIVASSALGTTATAALTVGSRLRMLTIMPALAFRVAAAALVGQSIGAEDWEQAEGIARETVKLCTAIMVVLVVLLLACAPWVIAVFSDDAGVIDVGTTMLRFLVVGQFFSAVAIASSGGLAGAGDTRPPLYYTIIGQWMVMLPLAWVLMQKVGLDPQGAWMAFAVAPVLEATLTLQRFRSGKWKHIRV